MLCPKRYSRQSAALRQIHPLPLSNGKGTAVQQASHIPIDVATTCDFTPESVQSMLPLRHRRIRRKCVFREQNETAGTQHSGHFR